MEYQCHLMFPENPPPILVKRWITKDEYTYLLFVGSNNSDKTSKDWFYNKEYLGEQTYKLIKKNLNTLELVYESLFKDDTIQTTLSKLLTSANIKGGGNETLYPYVWSEESPLRFRFLSELPEGYNVNPFYSNINKKFIPDIQQIGDRIVKYSLLEFVTYTDYNNKSVPPISDKYYFPNDKDTVNKRELIFSKNDNIMLTEIWTKSSEEAHKLLIDGSICTFTRAYFEENFEKPFDNYKHLFDKLDTNDIIPFIQLCDDLNNVYYKVSHSHNIQAPLFDEWTNMENILPKHSLILYSFIESNKSYMKLIFSQKTHVNISYRISSLDNIDYLNIDSHLSKIKEWLANADIIINPSINRLAIKTSIMISNVDLKGLAKYFVKYSSIFKLSTIKNISPDKSLDLIFVRVEKFGESTDLIDYIKSRITLHVPISDIVSELNEYGIDRDEVIDYIKQIQQEELDITKKPQKVKKNFSNMGLIINITKKSHELAISINNASSFTEIQNALFWIRCVVIKWSIEKDKMIKPPPKKKEKAPVVEPEPEPEPEPEEKSLVSDVSSLSSSGNSMRGGASDKDNERYLIHQLVTHDPVLFKDPKESYSRRCGASAKRQPIVMTLEEKRKIDESGFSDGYDNYIVYGSDPSKQNVYMCPRVYCPESRTPMSPEKYKQNASCPKGEAPILLYNSNIWDNNINKPHYVGFLNEKGSHNLYLPCCFVKKQTDLEAKIKGEVGNITGDGGYIIDKLKQLQVGRFGSIPSSLHDILHKDIPHKLCKNTVKTKECILRKGINKVTDSLLESISELLNFESKEKMCDEIKKKLDPFTFITLENGEVYTYFLPSDPILPEKNLEKRQKLKIWLLKHKKYVQLYDLDDIIEILDERSLTKKPPHILYKISKQLMIHEAYNRFLNYLYDAEMTNPYMLFDLIYHIGALLIIWDRENENIVTMRCPYSPKNKMWYSGHRNIPYIMVMQQETYYEPLVLVDQNKNVVQKVPFIHFDKLSQVISICPVMMKNQDSQIYDIYSLTKWIENLLSLPKQFEIERIIIDTRDNAIGCFLVNNLFIRFKYNLSVFSLKNVVELCKIKKVIYWEDIHGREYDIKCNIPDMKLLQKKLTKLNLILEKGTEIYNDGQVLQSKYKVPSIIYEEPPKIPLVIKDVVIRKTKAINDNEIWHTVKKTILKKLVKEYDTLIVPRLKLPKEKLLQEIYDVFKYLDEPSHTAVILEELPLYNEELLKKSLDELRFEKEYFYKDYKVHSDKKQKQWIFSQKAVQKNLIEDVKYPTTIERPKNYPKEKDEVIVNQKLSDPPLLPDFLNPKKLTKTSMPTKWRSKKFKEYQIGTLENFSKQSMIEVFQWIARQKDINYDLEDIELYLRKQIMGFLQNKETYELVLEDPFIRNLWNNKFTRKSRTINEMINNNFSKYKRRELEQMWLEISRNTPDRMIQDMDLYNISSLLNVNFLILQKGKKVSKSQGDLNELVGSSKFISNLKKSDWQYFPLFIFFKVEEKTHLIYSILLKENEISYFKFGSLVPDNIKNLIEEHVKKL